MKDKILWAVRLELPRPTRLLLCYLIANQGRAHSQTVTISQLMLEMQCNRRNVQRMLAELAEIGAIAKRTAYSPGMRPLGMEIAALAPQGGKGA